ncbi:hypothetical protein [Methylobacterium sp. J-090]|uniref:hypothetical protein n=1 Tax=Methylobacterium sp. J-090 TaxID=2836666 RepID=UPI001FBAA1A3|nr:hypothetical protein [Methylobacterium sp. J-090]MCJ2079864.1 hypothetical protein [Methylobacterium sp. J-090]
MASIHAFPSNIDGEAVPRLTEKLLVAFKAGEDLGSRVTHIHAIAETLERTLIDLDREVEGLNANLTRSEVDEILRVSGFLELRDQVRKMIALSRNFPG